MGAGLSGLGSSSRFRVQFIGFRVQGSGVAEAYRWMLLASGSTAGVRGDSGHTHRLHSSSFLGLPYRL